MTGNCAVSRVAIVSVPIFSHCLLTRCGRVLEKRAECLCTVEVMASLATLAAVTSKREVFCIQNLAEVQKRGTSMSELKARRRTCEAALNIRVELVLNETSAS